MDDIEVQLSKICLLMDENDRNIRRRGLQSLKDTVFQSKHQEEEDFMKIWEIVQKPLVRTINDSAEMCRDLGVEVLKNFILSLPVEEKNIAYIIPVLAKRLGAQELIEPSEEIRLNCVSFIRVIMNKYRNHLNPYFEDLVTILTRTVTDNYPEVKRESSQAISELAKIMPHQFYNHSERFVKGILNNFNHQHYRVRVASINTIGEVLQYGKSTIIEQIATPMAQRLFDQRGAVRAVIEVTGKWLVELRDRYSWWYKLIPLILTGLHDEIEEIRERSGQLWDAVGLKYLEENMSDQKIKDQIDFLEEMPKHYPLKMQRPNLGCRIIVQQNLGKLINGIALELNNWLVDIKIRSAQLLCVLVFHAEQDVVINFEKILPAMNRACNDQNSHVIDNIELTAKYMGYFISPSTYCPLVLLSAEENVTTGHLRVLACMLSGSEKSTLQPELAKLGCFIQQNYSNNKSVNYQSQILRCCKSLFDVCEEDCKEISLQLFEAIFSIMAMTQQDGVKKTAMLLLLELTKIERLDKLDDLYIKYIPYILDNIKDSCESWNIYTPEFSVFRACMSHAKCTVVRNSGLILPILESTTDSQADPEVRLKQYILLSEYFADKSDLFHNQSVDKVRDMINSLLEKVIFQGLIWSAGRSAEAIRTASIGCLCSMLEKLLSPAASNDQSNIPDLSKLINDFPNFFDQIVSVLVTLMDDKSMMTRFYTMKAICQIVSIGRKVRCIKDEHIHRIYPILLKRLDDGNDNVRIGAIEALQQIWMELPESYDYNLYTTHIDLVYTTTIIHLDDPEPKFQSLMLEAMKNLGKVHPGLMQQKIEKCRYNFRNQQGLECLLECVKGYLTNH